MFQREDYLTWDEYFMALAKLTAIRSKDPNSQVGAVIVDSENRVLSIGYNGAPNGFSDDLFPWAREGEELATKYPYVCHGELNAISNFTGSRKELRGAKIYVTLFPCNKCTQLIIQNGIKEVIYACDKYADTNDVKASKKMLNECGVNYRHFDLEDDILIEHKGSAQRQIRIRKRENDNERK